ncbi:MAG: alcohol dehydrogenase GroES-like domain protein [Candidatus Xenolissoclinum pacificiensis L6]|uniref:Alcohol dehydrogenase GroES-like domain protein n=1 Tax=Candidatus Xenolissoclinum pacificiensis L6 TaxID=1401685 RepID=W2UZ00_9RICK|nr:MAG: alcohol dehydrogenase GroES-like domain protein [Candidatus Xenolissoclinum pacificiensis L6]
MVKAVLLNKACDAQDLKLQDISMPKLVNRQVLVRNTYLGVNYTDIAQRSGAYKIDFPNVIGVEAVGVIEEMAPSVPNNLKVGQRVGYCTIPYGAYTEKRVINYEYLIPIPKEITDQQVVGYMFKALMANILLFKVVVPNTVIPSLLFDAASCTGVIISQIAKIYNIKLSGMVSNKSDVKIAKKNGCVEVFVMNGDVVKEIKETHPKGFLNIMDSVYSKETFSLSTQIIQDQGIYIMYDSLLSRNMKFDWRDIRKSSAYFVSPSFFNVYSDLVLLQTVVQDLFKLVIDGKVQVNILAEYLLNQVGKAHKFIEDKKDVGGSVIIKV